MLKKRLGIEAIERGRSGHYGGSYFKIPTSLIIPPSCRMIGPYAFSLCKKLREVVIPESVEEIKYRAFAFCGATIILKKSESEFKEIASNAFHGCKDVKEEIRS